MPSVSCYLNQDTIEDVKTIARTSNAPVSQIIREAVENYVKIVGQRQARERVLRTLKEKKPLGSSNGWEDIHHERIVADADRR